MIFSKPIKATVFYLALTAALSACTTLSYVSPDSVDFSGEWVIDPALSDLITPPRRSQNGSRGRGERGDTERGRGRESGDRRGSNRESGETQTDAESTADQSQTPMGSDSDRINSSNTREMRIEHSADSIGIIFPNGRIRDIDWGKIDRRHQQITAGWDGDKLVVKTVGLRGTIIEEFWLDASGDLLTIRFDVRGREFLRVYTRKTADDESRETDV